MKKTWITSLTAFLDRRILAIACFGFSSGLPFLLTLSTLTIWLKEAGATNTTIGLFVAVTLPYTFKFLWAPFVDRFKIPGLFSLLGQRRSWALVAQLSLMGMLVGLGSSHPEVSFFRTALWALGVTFCAAIQDITLEAYRIEIIDENQQGSAATATTLGWRLGLMASGAGALFLAGTYSWQTAYTLMAALGGVGVVTTLWSPRTHIRRKAAYLSLPDISPERFGEWLLKVYLAPLQQLWAMYDWRTVLAFILFYKVGDTVMSVMNTPFLVDLGFSKLEIANIAKLFGIFSMVIGGFVGGIFLNRYDILPSLILCFALQCCSSLMFVVQAFAGHSIEVLVLTMGLENFTCGFGATAFIAYLSSLCSIPYVASHFALLSSFGSFVRIGLSLVAGVLADTIPWSLFFSLTALGCLPGLLVLVYAFKKPTYRQAFLAPATPSS